MINTVFRSIRYGFNNKQIDFKIEDELSFSKMIFENGLIGIVVPYLDENSFTNKRLYEKLKKALNEYIVMDIKQNFYIEKIRNELNHKDISFVFLKGSHLKLIYPKSYMRAMGDIDIIVKDEDFEEVTNVFKKLDFKINGKTTHHLTFETIDEIDIELHSSVLSELEDKDSIYANIWNYFKDDKMGLEYELVYLVKHLARHFRSSGVGIRSLLDIEVFERHYEDVLNYDLVNEFLEVEGLKTFYLKVKEINLIILDNKEYSDETKDAINYLFKSGIHGTGSDYNQFVSRAVYDFKGSKFKYYFGMAFPKYKIMKDRYKYIKYIPILLPVAYIQRWISFLFKGRKSLKHRNEALKETELVKETKVMLNYFGLDKGEWNEIFINV